MIAVNSREKNKVLLTSLFFVAILIFFMWHLTGCVTILPKAPYPYSYHQENKTCDYWIYHKHWQTRGNNE